MELIDRKVIAKDIMKYLCHGCNNYKGVRCRACQINDCLEVIDDADTIDAVEVVRGHWEDCELIDGKDMFALGYKRCSICHGVGFLSEDAFGDLIDQTLTDFCPNCGADMRGEDR